MDLHRVFAPFRAMPALQCAALALLLAGCQTYRPPGTLLARSGDEIVVAGHLIHTGTRVITWMDPGGYDGYRVERRFAPWESADWASTQKQVPALTTPNRYGLRRSALTPEETERVRGGGWDLPLLQKVVDQFVLHYDASGTSRQCFKILHDMRGLSVHFLLDLDGTIYQTLDLKERAWHATTSNTRSIGIEIANIGAYTPGKAKPLDEWYRTNNHGDVIIEVPSRFGEPGFHQAGFVPSPDRSNRVHGTIHGRLLEQYDFTPEQYRALTRLTATLCKTFPKIACDYPRDREGNLICKTLSNNSLQSFEGILGHFHIQDSKVDPGPAFQWDRLIKESRRFLRSSEHPSRAPKNRQER